MFYLNEKLAINYKNNSQKARILTEFWTWENIFCPNCWEYIIHYANNKPVADFYCKKCTEDYELKSGKTLGKKITDWAYSTMINRLNSNENPNFFFLNYTLEYEIKNFFVIPKHYFTKEIIEERKPLAVHTQRAGWIWCNILLSPIPESWKIFYIKNWEKINKNEVLDNRNKTLFLRETKSIEWKWWILDIMKCIENLHKKEFSLQELYNLEPFLKEKYPNNNFIKDKIRQQLQFLRDKWYLEFMNNGKYKLNHRE